LILFSWLSTIKFFHFFTALVAFKYRLVLPRFNLLFLSILTITFLIPTFFEFTSFDTSGRYWIFNMWIFYIYSAIGLNYCFNKCNTFVINKRKLSLGLLWIVIIIYIGAVLFDKSSKKSYSQAFEWVISNKINLDEIYTNDTRINTLIRGYQYSYQESDVKFLVLNNNLLDQRYGPNTYDYFSSSNQINLLHNISGPDSEFSIYSVTDK